MSANRGSRDRVVLCADVVGSTRLYDELGDERAKTLISDRLDRVIALVHGRRGELIAEVGDEIICLFDDVSDAAAASCEAHAELADINESRSDDEPEIEVRIGIHSGELPGSGEDLMTETAKIAQWAAGNAKPDQTLITRRIFDALPSIYRALSRYVDDETWNFVSIEHMELYELVWDVEAVTAYSGEEGQKAQRGYALVRFRLGETTIELDDDRPVISAGRSSRNLVAAHDLVSRQHFSAQFSRGRCTITDNSTNGTFIVHDDGSQQEVRRETLPLTGSGLIFLGEPSEAKQGYAISFSCER